MIINFIFPMGEGRATQKNDVRIDMYRLLQQSKTCPTLLNLCLTILSF